MEHYGIRNIDRAKSELPVDITAYTEYIAIHTCAFSAKRRYPETGV